MFRYVTDEEGAMEAMAINAAPGVLQVSAHPPHVNYWRRLEDAKERENVNVVFVALMCNVKRRIEDARHRTPVFGDLPTKNARYPHVFV